MDIGSVKILNSMECLQIVRNHMKTEDLNDIKLKSYAVKRGSNDLVGFMGEYYILNVCLEDKSEKDGEKCLQYFVKSIPISNEYHKDECERKGFFKKETRVYTDILPNVQKYVSSKLFPECYYTRNDLIVLEDLSTKNYRQLAVGETYTINHYKLALKHLAKLHAASLAWELEANINIGEKFQDVLFEIQLTMNNEWYVAGIKGIIFLAKMSTKFQDVKSQKFIHEKLYDILCNAELLTKPSKRFKNVLCHRDTWDRNLFFKFNNDTEQPVDCCIVDFQLTRYSPPGIDVLFFLYINYSPEQRQQIYNNSLDYYHSSLRESLMDLHIAEDLISKEEFLQDVENARLAVLILWAICEPLLKMPNGLSNKIRAEEQKNFDHYMNTEREQLFLRIIAIEPAYKNAIMTPVEELLDYLLQRDFI